MRHLYIHRQIEQVLKNAARSFSAVALTGPRQSGKSTLLRRLFEKTHRYVTFDDPLVREQAVSDPRLFMENLGERAIIDEIQYVPQIVSHLKIAIDTDRQKKGKFLLTGSEQFTMIKNLGDSLAGRVAILELLPFSFEEKKNTPRIKQLDTSIGSFADACLGGSYPELLFKKADEKNRWYSSYLNTYLERDIRTLHDIGSLRDFQRFLQLLAARTAQILNLSTFSVELGVSINTLKKWLSILEASRIIYLLYPYYENFGKRMTQAPKIYFLDCGLACYLVGIKDREYLLKGPMAGSLFETFCLQETLKIFLSRGLRAPLYYLRLQNDLEVDFLIEGAAKTFYPVEVKVTKTPKPSMAGPIERTRKLFPKLHFSEGRVVSLSDQENFFLGPQVRSQGFLEYSSWLKTII
jgi:predicted AAA+ superfamily ATPase